MSKQGFLGLLAALSVLVACATAANIYKPATGPKGVGYSETQIDAARYRVTFVAPNSVDRSKLLDLALLRGAELTTSSGHSWFRVANRTITEIQVDRPKVAITGTTSAPMSCGLGPTGSTNNLGCAYTPSNTAIAGADVGVTGGYDTRYIAIIEIIMGDGAPPSVDNVYDAKATADRVRATMKQ